MRHVVHLLFKNVIFRIRRPQNIHQNINFENFTPKSISNTLVAVECLRPCPGTPYSWTHDYGSRRDVGKRRGSQMQEEFCISVAGSMSVKSEEESCCCGKWEGNTNTKKSNGQDQVFCAH